MDKAAGRAYDSVKRGKWQVKSMDCIVILYKYNGDYNWRIDLEFTLISLQARTKIFTDAHTSFKKCRLFD